MDEKSFGKIQFIREKMGTFWKEIEKKYIGHHVNSTFKETI